MTAMPSRRVVPETTKSEYIGPLTLESGAVLEDVEIAYETFGTLSPAKDNTIWVCHALTGDAHAAGEYPPGWWSNLIGPGRYINTDRFFVVCSNVLGGCGGSTGPASLNPANDRPYGLRFPTVTVRDMVNAQHGLMERLGIEKLYAVIGGSMGGMQVLEWAVMYPDQVERIIPMATSSRLSAMAIAYNDVGRQAIFADPQWLGGDYYPGLGPVQGFSIARMVGMITYRTQELYDSRFGRKLREGHEITQFDSTFQVESYLRYQGEKLVQRFDANSYLYLLKAMDSHDLSRGRGGMESALARIQAKILMIGIRDDLLYPMNHIEGVVERLNVLGKQVVLKELQSPFGHDAFLVEFDEIGPDVQTFLSQW